MSNLGYSIIEVSREFHPERQVLNLRHPCNSRLGAGAGATYVFGLRLVREERQIFAEDLLCLQHAVVLGVLDRFLAHAVHAEELLVRNVERLADALGDHLGLWEEDPAYNTTLWKNTRKQRG